MLFRILLNCVVWKEEIITTGILEKLIGAPAESLGEPSMHGMFLKADREFIKMFLIKLLIRKVISATLWCHSVSCVLILS